DRDLQAEYAGAAQRLAALLGAAYQQPVVFFEHGTARDGARVMCTVDHAHLHMLPLPAAFAPEVLSDPAWVPFDGSVQTLPEVVGAADYLVFGAARAAWVRVAPPSGFESQYLRREIAQALGRAERWNWRTFPDPQAADETWRRLS